MAQPWLHYGCSKAVPLKLQFEVSGHSRRFDLAETLQLSADVIALHLLQRMHKSIQISLSQLTVLLPLHGAGIGSQRWKFVL